MHSALANLTKTFRPFLQYVSSFGFFLTRYFSKAGRTKLAWRSEHNMGGTCPLEWSRLLNWQLYWVAKGCRSSGDQLSFVLAATHLNFSKLRWTSMFGIFHQSGRKWVGSKFASDKPQQRVVTRNHTNQKSFLACSGSGEIFLWNKMRERCFAQQTDMNWGFLRWELCLCLCDECIAR